MCRLRLSLPLRQVLALARNDAADTKVKTLGATPHRGDLTDLAALKAGASQADAVLHLGFIHDWANYMASIQTDAAAVEAMLAALEGSGKTFVGTSGTMLGAGTVPLTERDGPSTPNPRGKTEQDILAAAARGVRALVVRLAPSVHGPHDHGFVPMLIAAATKAGHASFVGDGANVWPAVHVDDAAALFVLALDAAKAPSGVVLHAAAENLAFGEIARAIGAGLKLETRSVDAAQAADALGFIATFTALNNPTSTDATRAWTGWAPKSKGLLEEIATGDYFA